MAFYSWTSIKRLWFGPIARMIGVLAVVDEHDEEKEPKPERRRPRDKSPPEQKGHVEDVRFPVDGKDPIVQHRPEQKGHSGDAVFPGDSKGPIIQQPPESKGPASPARDSRETSCVFISNSETATD